jgi:hypothetical protein
MSFHTVLSALEGRGAWLILEGSTEDMVEQYIVFSGALWSVSVVGWGGFFHGHGGGERGC